MSIINTVLGVPLGYVMWACYMLVKNYGLAIILFTLFSKIILFPLAIATQKNSIKNVKIQPMLDEVKRRYAGDKDKIAEEQIKLYDEVKYSPAMGCLPTLIQIPLILGLINVIYNPFQHLLHMSRDAIALFVDRAQQILQLEQMGGSPQLRVLEALHNPNLLPQFETLRSQLPDYDSLVNSMLGLDMNFFGLDLSRTTSIFQPSALWLIPIIATLSAFLFTWLQSRQNVLQQQQGALYNWGMTIGISLFSLYFTFVLPVGVGLYWTASNLFSIAQQGLLNKLYDPKKYIDYSTRPQQKKLTPEERRAQKERSKAIKEKEREDKKRFYESSNGPKQLVFYSEKSGFYKYFENVIDYVLNHSDVTIHYVTGDPDDAVFQMKNPRILPYYVGDTALISFMMKMDADMVVMTMPDLETYQIKRSLVRKDIEYVYLFHGLASTHMVLRKGALDHYDTLLAVGPHQVAEIRATERVYKLPEKKVIEAGYGLIENLTAKYEAMDKRRPDGKYQVLIAPSWQPDNIMECCIDQVLDQLLDRGWRVVLRPHPEYLKRFPEKMDMVMAKYGAKQGSDFIVERDFAAPDTVYKSDLLITDWSTIAHEFSYSTHKPSLFIDTPMKVMNDEYEKIGIEPLDITLRNEIGKSIPLDKLDTLGEVAAGLLAHLDAYGEKITGVVDKYVFNLGRYTEVAGGYIVEELEVLKAKREASEL